KIVMEALIDDLSAKQIHKYPRAAEEDYGSEYESFVDAGECRVGMNRICQSLSRERNGCQKEHQHNRKKSRKVYEKRSLAEKSLLHFKPHYGRRLARPQRPNSLFGGPCCSLRAGHCAHLLSPSEPIRY